MTQIEKADRGFEKHSGKILVALMIGFFSWFISSHQTNTIELGKRGVWMTNMDSKLLVIEEKLSSIDKNRFNDKDGQRLRELVDDIRSDLKALRFELKEVDKRVYVLERE